MKNNNIILTIRDYIIITIGVILVAFGLEYFFVPNQIAGGGLSGLSLVISHYIPMLSIGTIIFLGNLILFVIAFILVGGDFGMKTIYASFALSFIMDFMEKVMHSYALTSNLLLAVLIGTLITASGIGITFALNASTGGTDILAKILNKYSSINLGISLLIVDLFVVVCGALTFGLNKGLYSLLAVIMNGLLVDRVIVQIEKKQKEKANADSKLAA
ncbi:YitT family protein [Terrisporobacter sp.]